jgi:hypothetical protein
MIGERTERDSNSIVDGNDKINLKNKLHVDECMFPIHLKIFKFRNNVERN